MKRWLIGITTIWVVILGILGSHTSQTKTIDAHSKTPSSKIQTTRPSTNITVQPVAQPVLPSCDGTTNTSHCIYEGITYKTYVYHPAVEAKSHLVTTTSYQKKVTGYCTLCNDNTYSPSCATGRGACSYHDGVQQWNAPRYSEVPVTTTATVVDAPAQAEYIEKVAE